jgi:hypothetical protein
MDTQNIPTRCNANPKMVPMVLSITGNLLLWTLGFATMSVATENNPQRIVQEFPIDPSRAENLQRWVNSGHDTWCRSGNLVAQATLQRISPEFSATDTELASLPAETKQLNPNKVIYTYHSLDGHTTYRITVVRYPSLLHSANPKDAQVWLPIRSEKIIEDSNTQQPSTQNSAT